jgi:maltose-binding protein MalE
MREAAAMILPPRRSVLNDPELQKANRHYPASLASLEIGEPFPRLPEFYEVGEFITRRILQAVTDEMSVQEALDAAAAESEDLLRSRGYYNCRGGPARAAPSRR